MIPQNLIDYVKVYENHLPADLCELVTDKLSTTLWEKHAFYDARTGATESFDNEPSVNFADIEEKKEIDKRVWFALERYVCQDFESFKEWFAGWNGYMHVRFNRYEPGTQMKLHWDHIQSLFDGERKGIPTLTVLGALNDDYEGGELMMFGDHQIDMPTGSIVVFPSSFMFPHGVRPVRSGVRYSYVSWAW